MTSAVITRRRAERDALVAAARGWATQAGPALHARAVVLVGSVARGDFNKWSDVDVLVVIDELPDGLTERLALVGGVPRPPGVQVIAWTGDELSHRHRRGTDPLAREAYGPGVLLYGTLPAASP